jgi:hypothetical protein
MKRTLLFSVLAAALWSCTGSVSTGGNAEPPAAAAEAAEAKPEIVMPYKALYSSDFSMGNPEYTKKVLDMYKALEENRIDDIAQYHADTVTRFNYAQKYITLSRDSLIKVVKKFRSQFKEFSETPEAFMAVHANDKNEDWVLTWIEERVTYPNGRKDSTTYQECWRFNKEGKIYWVDSFAKFAQ